VLFVFVVLGLVSSVPINTRDWLGRTSHRNELFCVELDVKH